MNHIGVPSVASGWSQRLISVLLSVTLALTGLLTGSVPHAAAVGETQEATITAWGSNSYGEGRVPEAAEPALSIAAGAFHNVVLRTDGKVVAWGANGYGQTDVPDGLSDVIAVDAGTDHSLALRSDGTVVAWGSNRFFETEVPEGLTEVTAIAAGDGYSLALRRDGTVVAWGIPRFGQASVPVGLDDVMAISAGTRHSLALKSDGTVVAWGHATESTVPDGLTEVVAVAAGHEFSMALKADGDVVLFGELNAIVEDAGGAAIAAGGYYGLSATGSDYARVALIMNAEGNIVWANNVNVPEGLGAVAAVAAGGKHALALKSDGTLVAFGDRNDYGQASVPRVWGEVKAVSAGYDHNLALLADGTVTGWGYNWAGQTDVPGGLTGVTAVAAGYGFSLALKQDGTVVWWGNAVAAPGELHGVTAIAAGFNTSLALLSDGAVVAWGGSGVGASDVPSGLSGVVSIAAGWDRSLALKADGTVVGWGNTTVPEGLDNIAAISAGFGCLALTRDGTVVGWDGVEVPVGLTDIVAVSAGNGHYMALRSDGTVIAWGNNSDGQATVPSGLAGVTAIAAGGHHSLAISSGTSEPTVVPLAATDISTPRGGNTGNVTLTVSGTGFQEGSVVKLVRTGEADIVGVTKNVISNTGGLSTILATFDLTEKPLGVRDVVVVNPDGGSAVLPGAFTIVTGGEAQGPITLDIVGPSVVRVGGSATLYAVVRNESLNDAEVTLEISEEHIGVVSSTLPALAKAEAGVASSTSISPGNYPFTITLVIAAGASYIAAFAATMCGQPVATIFFIQLGRWLTHHAVIHFVIESAEHFKCEAVNSIDPNDIVGPAGSGNERFVREEILFPYTVFFENKPDATAPAQEVVITDQLDPSKVDLDTFVFRGITFGDQSVVPTEGVSEFTTDVDLRPANDLIVRINAGLDKTTGLVTWRFTSIDPETGELTEDPLAGFLSPNVTSPEGEGSVSFTVEPKKGLSSGTTISNQARIVFDTNDPIDTPVWTNTLDSTDPASQVGALPATQETAAINVQWSGSDTGSGVHDCTIYVSEDGAPYTVWLPNTTDLSGTFTGLAGHSYRFFSSARDGAGNVEPFPSGPDTNVQVLAPTPPVITPTVTGTPGSDEWYTGDVSVTWQVRDDESAITTTLGCDPSSITTDTDGKTLTCTATSAGGTSSGSVTVKRDAAPPAVVWDAAGPADQASYPEGQVPPAPTCTDAMSGVAECAVTGRAITVGTHTVSVSATDNAGNTITETRSYTVTAVNDPPVVQFTVVPLYKLDKANKVGSTIPIKIQVQNDSKNVSKADLPVRASSLTMGATTIEPVPDPGKSQPDGHFSYDATLGDGGGYQFNVKTTGLTPGTWTLNFTIGDELKPHGTTFVVRK